MYSDTGCNAVPVQLEILVKSLQIYGNPSERRNKHFMTVNSFLGHQARGVVCMSFPGPYVLVTTGHFSKLLEKCIFFLKKLYHYCNDLRWAWENSLLFICGSLCQSLCLFIRAATHRACLLFNYLFNYLVYFLSPFITAHLPTDHFSNSRNQTFCHS